MLPLKSLGERIVIIGPSNAGKSTLAVSIAQKVNAPAIHLDQYHHLPNTNWQKRPDEEFRALHDQAILADKWVMEGNYSQLMPQRMERATGAILLTSNRWLRLYRYFKRTLINNADRAGHLQGAHDSVKRSMIDWIIFKTKDSDKKYAKLLQASRLPLVEIHSAKELNALYQTWNLSRGHCITQQK
ncbi:adenylate kinase family enzyme [Paenochrobactrum gallinarii]|uniref:Adenylate kinase family enzyme n=1 Tax=Paenochrobactrum gallinarii TaxID=643673 RepID=A0A841LRC2_9HYPH|nr:AAA family ATPase [Paenochrobactrum gallinarii]MBB6259776.1 adenylate kinase family enzyme [Paenochrobactrum gallinarii]